MKQYIPYLGSFILGLLLTLAFYPISIFPFVISFGGFYFLLKKNIDSNLKLFLHGILFGYGYFFINLYWIPLSIYKAPMNLEWLVPILSILIPLPFALFIGVFAILTKLGRHNSVIYSINFSFLWVIFEYIRSNLFFPFPWALIGYSATSMLWFAQIVSFFGAYATSLFTVLLTTSLFSQNKKYIGFNIFLFLLMCMVGESHIESDSLTDNDNIKVRLVQPNIQEQHFGNKEKQISILQTLSELTLSTGFKESNYVFWPEAAFPYPIQKQQNWVNMMKDFVPPNQNAALVFGADSIKEDYYTSLSFNSILAINKTGEMLGYYDKKILVPFGEYIPYKKKFSFMKKIAFSANIEDISKGTQSNIIDLGNNVKFLPIICSESIADMDNFEISSHNNYRFILSVTNDAWFGSSLGPYQHFNISRIRAIEYGLPVLRVANTGISGVIDTFGKVLKSTELNVETVVDSIIPSKLKKPTLFYRIHDFVMPTILILYALLILYLLYLKWSITYSDERSSKKIIPKEAFKDMDYR